LADTLSVTEKLSTAPEEMEKLDSVEAVLGHFTHKLNNTTATILGKAQMAKLALVSGKIQDPEGKLMPALQSIEASVAKICELVRLLEILPNLKKQPE
jgi:hypothetical protein